MERNTNIIVHVGGNTIKTHHPRYSKLRFGCPLRKMFANGWRYATKGANNKTKNAILDAKHGKDLSGSDSVDELFEELNN